MTAGTATVVAAADPVWRGGARCVRCGGPATVRLLTPSLAVYSACAEHGRDLWRGLGGKRSDGRDFVWWPL